MSFGLHPYVLRIEKVAKIYASSDEELLHAVVQQEKQALKEIRMLADEEYSPIEALKNIIFGEINPTTEGEVYAFVVELICKYLGQAPKAEHWQNLSMNWLMDINLAAALPIRAIPLPKTFPYVLSLRYQDIEDFVDIMGALELEEEAWKEFEHWVHLAHKSKEDLILFFY